MIPAVTDPSLYRKPENDQLIVIDGSYVDDLIRAKNDQWEHLSHPTLESFETTGNEQPPFTFAVMRVAEARNMIIIHQDIYMKKIEQILNDADFMKFASIHMRLA